MFKKVLILLISLTVFLSTPLVSFAQSAEELQSQIDQYIQKLDELGKSKNTLSNQIKLLDSQYQLTLLKITQTENSIKKLEKEIADLIVEIDKLRLILLKFPKVIFIKPSKIINFKNGFLFLLTFFIPTLILF